ncbi:MAG: hypothetical protein WD036_06700 [Bauldia sp.]
MYQTSETTQSSQPDSPLADLWWFLSRMALAAAAAVAAHVLMTGDSFAGVAGHAFGDAGDVIAFFTGGQVTCLCLPN